MTAHAPDTLRNSEEARARKGVKSLFHRFAEPLNQQCLANKTLDPFYPLKQLEQ
jgi:hypothetical protein